MRILVIVLAWFIVDHATAQGPPADAPAETASPSQMAAFLQQVYGQSSPPEGAKMFLAILEGSQMGAGEGWFGPAQTRFDFQWLAKQCDLEVPAEGIPREKFVGPAELFSVLDRNRDGVIQPQDLEWSDENPYVGMMYTLNRVFRRLDAAGAGQLSREDWLKFFDEAAQDRETLTAEDFSGSLLAGYTGSFAPGDGPDTATLIRGLFDGEIGSMCEGPQVGQRAPLFSLRKVQGDGVIELSSLLGEKPLVIVLGNFTCGPFRAFYPAVDALYQKYKDQANFLMVYVREAHPTDGWSMESNTRVGVAVAQPRTFDQRAEVAEQFCTRLSPSMPVVVDELSDPVGHAYSGMPARLYLIDQQGEVAYKGGRGPFGFRPPELEQALAMCLLESSRGEPRLTTATQSASGLDVDNEEVLRMLPQTLSEVSGPLPNWTRPIAEHLPRTAAAMIRLDYAQRTLGPLDPKLRAKLRYVIAQANRCVYSQETALADLRAAGGSEAEEAQMRGRPASWPAQDEAAMTFVQQLSLEASRIDDELFAQLRRQYGDREVAAMVLLGAYGNFQDRILLGLGVELEPSGPLASVDIEFSPDAFQVAPLLPPNQPPATLRSGGQDVITDHGDWASIRFEELQNRLQKQRSRKQRLPTPTWDAVASKLPPEFSSRPTRIVWSLVCLGYVPELAVPWSTTTRTMWSEAQNDRVLEESLFWVQTRAIECNYCMGHCEMLLEVAGLDQPRIEERLQHLASDDWSAFPEHEQRTYAYARKLTLRPWELTRQDYEQLERDLGPKQAMATFFWLCRGLYMTRVSDGFQLQLESENVFVDFAKPQEKE